jgi:hypothetical protein
MVLSYIPLGLYSVCDYLRVNKSKYVTPYLYEKFDFYIENKYCKYILKRGKNRGYICGRKCTRDGYCKQHIKGDNNINKYNYCIGRSIRNENCKRIVKKEGDLCSYHKTVNVVKNNKSLFLIKIIIKFIILYNATRKKKEKEQNIIDKIRNIKLIDIITYLKINYNYEGNTIRLENNIVVKDNRFFDNKYNYGSGGSIDFYMHLKKCTYKTAIKELYYFFSFPSSLNSETLKNKKSLSIENVREDKTNIDKIKDYLINIINF